MRSLAFSLLVAAASFVSDVAALGTSCSAALTPTAAASSPFWLGAITKRGTSAFNASPASYKVFRSVKDYGAKGDGVTDDTAAINAAITDGNRCGLGCKSSTLTPALVYFPSGTYLVSTPIIPLYYTSLVGDKKNLPVLKATAGFNGIAVIDADPYIAGGAQYYVNQNNFFRAVRNFVIDVTAVPASTSATGLHWQVAQATSLVNVIVNMSTASGNNHQGIFMENGSGGVMTDLVFNGGKFGIWVGNQQFTVRNITVNNAQTGIYSLWNWGWTYAGVTLNNCGIGFDIATGGTDIDHQSVGALSILDVTATNVPVLINTSTQQTTAFAGSIVLENAKITNVPKAVVSAGNQILAGTTGTTTIASWGQGNTYVAKATTPAYKQGALGAPTKVSSLTSGGKIFGRPRPQYENYAVDQFVSVKAEGAKGDGVTDDTAALQAVFNKYWGCKIIYVDAGTYVITDTLKIPAGSFVVGELWSNIQLSGSKFTDGANPRVGVQVGVAGDSAKTEISDIVFTTKSGLAGAIVVEWNVKDAAGVQGSAAMWDSHVRIGGYKGSGIQTSNCAKLSGHATAPCVGSYLNLRLTSSSSAYLENVWIWTADHDLDDAGESQIDVYAARGILIESQNPVWLYGTASEHHAIYQYNIVSAKAVFIALIQTETPYYQPSPAAPAPFTTNTALHDPTYAAGKSAFALRILTSSNIYAYGVNLYSFFISWVGDEVNTCVKQNNCQSDIFSIDSASNQVYIYSLTTLGVAYQLTVDGTSIIPWAQNKDGFASTATFWKSAS